jgi:hypothetical protein
MWREFIRGLTPECEFSEPATSIRIRNAESKLGLPLPSDLRDFFRESDGVLGQFGLGVVWSLDRVVSDNLSFRKNSDFSELYMPFDHLLFFADAGNGDQFAFPIKGGAVTQHDVYAWDHENDSRTWVASSLKQYVEWWLSGKIQL